MLAYGCTRLEVGLQSTYEDVARDSNRGHTVAAVGTCFQLAKDAGFKVRPALFAALHQPAPARPRQCAALLLVDWWCLPEVPLRCRCFWEPSCAYAAAHA